MMTSCGWLGCWWWGTGGFYCCFGGFEAVGDDLDGALVGGFLLEAGDGGLVDVADQEGLVGTEPFAQVFGHWVAHHTEACSEVSK